MTAQRAHSIEGGGFYVHVFNRGVEGKTIFSNNQDYSVFMGFLQEYLTSPNPQTRKTNFTVNGRDFQGIPHQPKNYFGKIELVAYSLNPDHFHLILHQIEEGKVEGFMRSLSTRYSIYYNKKYQRRGSLFEGPYKSIRIDDITQLKLLTKYLHREQGVNSYSDYIGNTSTQWLKPSIIVSSFKRQENSYRDFVEKYSPNETEKNLLNDIVFDNPDDTPKQTPSLKGNQDMVKIHNPKSKARSRALEYFSLSSAFIVLLALGVRNINITSANTNAGQISQVQTSEVLSQSDSYETYSPSPSPQSVQIPISPDIPEPSSTPIPIDPSPTPLTVSIGSMGSSNTANIYQEPSLESPLIKEASTGDVFEAFSVGNDWYQIKLPDQSIGYIQSKDIIIEHSITE